MCVHFAGSVQRSIHPLFGSGIHTTLQARSASRTPCVAWMCLAAPSGCISPGLFQAISHLLSNLSQSIITIFAIITLTIVFPQVSSGAAEGFRQCKIFQHKYCFPCAIKFCACFFSVFCQSLIVTTPASPRCYSWISGEPVREGSMYKHNPLLFPDGNSCIINCFQIFVPLLLIINYFFNCRSCTSVLQRESKL